MSEPTELECLLDNCPTSGRAVDYRRCQRCPHFVESAHFGSIGCNHPSAKRAPGEIRRANCAAFHATAASAGHLLYTGPLQDYQKAGGVK